jgi:hypothetical protein
MPAGRTTQSTRSAKADALEAAGNAQKSFEDTKTAITESAAKVQEKAQQAQEAADALKKLTE